MTVHSKTCVLVECDGTSCGSDKGWPDGDGPWHFDTLDGAMKALIGEEGFGWTRLPDGRLLCRACSTVADCAATDHQWTEWRPHSRTPHVEWRHCKHCGAFDERLEVADHG